MGRVEKPWEGNAVTYADPGNQSFSIQCRVAGAELAKPRARTTRHACIVCSIPPQSIAEPLPLPPAEVVTDH